MTMSYCPTCDCNVAHSNLSDHVAGRRHRQNEQYQDHRSTDNLTWCSLCACQVPRSGFGDHVSGARHQQNLRNSDDDETTSSSISDGGYYSDGERLQTNPSRIRYSQDSISPCFGDGTSLREGIDNLNNGEEYEIEVDYVNGELVALNNRTLYCYNMSDVKSVTVVVNRGEVERRGREVCGYDIEVRTCSRF